MVFGKLMPAPGDVLGGRYRIDGALGEGGLGRVYDGTQVTLARPVAIKVLRPEAMAAADARQRFEREARVAATLKHPNAVKIYDFGEDQGWLYLAMERLTGWTLREAVESGPMSVERACATAAQVADVLVAAHGIGLVHRDVKPENIFLEAGEDGSERVVVVDFGLAFIEHREDVGRMTQEGVLSGTPAYVAPEQARAVEIGPPADIYGLGCVLYEMLTGAIPFDEESTVEMLLLHIFGTATPPREARPDLAIPARIDELTMAMLAKSPRDRPSALIVRATLEAVGPAGEARGRSRGGEALLTREARTAPSSTGVATGPDAPTLTQAPPVDEEQGSALVAVVGELGRTAAATLALAGLRAQVVEPEAMPSDAEAIVAFGATAQALELLVELGLPVLADAEAGDFGRMEELLAVGVDDVLLSPIREEDLSRKTWRAIRKRRRFRRS